MSANVSKLTPKQEQAVLALLTNQGVDNAARAVGIGPRTLYQGEARPRSGFLPQRYQKPWRWESGKPAFGFGGSTAALIAQYQQKGQALAFQGTAYVSGTAKTVMGFR